MDIGGRGYGDQLVAVLSAATDVLRELPGRVHQLTGADLDVVLPVVDALAAAAAAGRFTLTAEAVDRGEVAASQAGSTAQWVADRCPGLDAREAGLVAKAVRELAPSGTPLAGERAGALAGARAAVAAGCLSVPAGCVVAAELAQLVPLVEPSAVEAVAAGLVAMGQVDGPVGVRRVRPALLARYGLGEQLQEVEDRHRGLTVLSCGHDIGGGITQYRLRLNPEARAVVEAAINTASAPQPLSRPQPQPGTGEIGGRDLRTIDQRRGDALVEICRRAVSTSPAPAPAAASPAAPSPTAASPTAASPAAASPTAASPTAASPVTVTAAGVTPTTVTAAGVTATGVTAAGVTAAGVTAAGVKAAGVKAAVLVTIGLDDLRDRTRPGVVLAGLDGGALLGPETVRKLACDAAVIPAVLGADGHVLDLGRTRRLFSTGQVQALWLRDRHCTFPGCQTPASWCDAHHLRHWVDGGPTDLGNAALLCGRHHTIVHRDRLTATVTVTATLTNDNSQDHKTGPQVVWDRRPGSYDRTLADEAPAGTGGPDP